MNPIDEKTYEHKSKTEDIIAVIGDEKQGEYYSRIKLKKWRNEANISLGYSDTPAETVKEVDGVVEAVHGDTVARIYDTHASGVVPLTSIRRVANNDSWGAIQATAEYEMFNQIGEPGTMLMAHYRVTEPTVATFDLMPADLQLEVDAAGFAQDFNYTDKSLYHPSDIPIATHDKLRVVRYFTPYTPVVNPYYMDDGIHNIDLQWHGSELTGANDKLMTAIETVLNGLGVETKRHEVRSKLYFKHGGRWVKFYSGQEEQGGLYAYINIASCYNKVFDFYKDTALIQQDVRDKFAYGLQFGHPSIDHSIVDTIMSEFATIVGVSIKDDPYTKKELDKWAMVQELQDTYNWNILGQRNDANWFRLEHKEGIEFEVVLNSAPVTNQLPFTGSVPKEAIAYWQAPMPFSEQMAQRVKRPADVWGSFAIYHTDKRNNEYQAGKIAHIYRPMAYDATGRRVFCRFIEGDGLEDGAIYDLSQGLTVEVPQGFLDSATYPVTVDPTFGYTTAGASSADINDTINATLVTTGADTGNVASISYYSTNAATGSNATTESALYDNNGSFNYLEDTTNITEASTTAGWKSLKMDTYYAISASTNYILAVWGEASGSYAASVDVSYDSTVGKTSYTLSSNYTANTWPSTLSGVTTQTDRQYSIYATYGYQWPIMHGNSASLAAANAERHQPLSTGSATTWSTSLGNQQVIAPHAATITELRVDLTTAPGATKTRIFNVNVDAAASSLGMTIADTATTATDSTDAAPVATAQTVSLNSTGTLTPAGSSGNRWRAVWTSVYQPWFASSIGALSTTATRYIGVQDGAGVSASIGTATQIMPPDTGVLQNFYVELLDASLTSGSYTFTLVKNSVDTAAVLTVTAATASYTATTISVTDQDTLYWKIVPSTPTAPSAAARFAIACEYKSDTTGRGVLFGGANANIGSVTTYSIWHNDAWNATENLIYGTAYTHIVIGMRATLSAAPSSTHSRTLTYRKNAAGGTPAITISGASTTGTWSGTYAVATDDTVALEHTYSGTPTNSNMKYGIVFNVIPTTDFIPKIIMF